MVLTQGLSLNMVLTHGFNPTMKPLTSDRFQKLDIVTYLLSAGAVKEARDTAGRTALHVSVFFFFFFFITLKPRVE